MCIERNKKRKPLITLLSLDFFSFLLLLLFLTALITKFAFFPLKKKKQLLRNLTLTLATTSCFCGVYYYLLYSILRGPDRAVFVPTAIRIDVSIHVLVQHLHTVVGSFCFSCCCCIIIAALVVFVVAAAADVVIIFIIFSRTRTLLLFSLLCFSCARARAPLTLTAALRVRCHL